jgi:hypothetical protein
MTTSNNSFVNFGDTASNSSLSSFDVRLLTVAHHAMLIVSASISPGNDQPGRKQLHTWSRPFSFAAPRSILNTSGANAPFFQLSNVAFHGRPLLNRSHNAAITWAITWSVGGLSCTHLQTRGTQRFQNSLTM